MIDLFPKADRSFVLRQEREVARRRVAAARPFSPAWDAAMAQLEDVEREVWRLGAGSGNDSTVRR